MTEACFHVVYEPKDKAYPWWAECEDVDNITPSHPCLIGYGSTPGQAVDALIAKMQRRAETVPGDEYNEAERKWEQRGNR